MSAKLAEIGDLPFNTVTGDFASSAKSADLEEFTVKVGLARPNWHYTVQLKCHSCGVLLSPMSASSAEIGRYGTN